MPELLPKRYGLKYEDTFNYEGILHCSQTKGSLLETIEYLQQTYCNTLSAEFIYLQVCKREIPVL